MCIRVLSCRLSDTHLTLRLAPQSVSGPRGVLGWRAAAGLCAPVSHQSFPIEDEETHHGAARGQILCERRPLSAQIGLLGHTLHLLSLNFKRV